MASGPGEFHPQALSEPYLCRAHGYGEPDASRHVPAGSTVGFWLRYLLGTPHKNAVAHVILSVRRTACWKTISNHLSR